MALLLNYIYSYHCDPGQQQKTCLRFLWFFDGNEHGDRGGVTSKNTNNCSGLGQPPVGGSGGCLSSGRYPDPCEDPDPDPEQLFGFGPAPKRPGHLLHEQPGKSGRNTPIIPRSRGPMSSPTPMAPIGPDPEQFFGNPEVPASSPRTVRTVGFSGLYAILNCILWVMFNNINIWCDIHHSGLR